jgi:hypothetical protein
MAAKKEPWSLKKPNLLIVEGYSDLHFIAEFLEHLGNHETTDIYIVGGRSQFELLIPALLQPPTLAFARHIGVVLDADRSADGAFRQIQAILSCCGGVAVPSPGVWAGDCPRYGIFVCPDGNRAGELETAAWEAWAGKPENRDKTVCIEKYIACMKGAGVEGKSPDKVRVGAMLAVHNDDDPRVGPGAQKRLFDFDSAALEPMRAFLAPLAAKPVEKAP